MVAGRLAKPGARVVRPADSPPEREQACRSSLCAADGNLAAVGHEYMVSKHRGGRAPPTRSGSPEGKGIR
jgi:hypothetical protein